MTRQADRNAERQDPKGLGPEGMRAAVCEADAPTTSPMDKTVEVSQAARDAAAVDAANEYPRFCTWLKNHLPGVEPSPTSHLFDAWMASAREATTRATQPEAALRKALEAIRDLQPEPFNFPADWQDQIAACEECKRYEGHPIQRGICDTHRRPIWNREKHDRHQEALAGYRAKSIAADALAALKDHRHG